MSRAPFQVLVLPFRTNGASEFVYALFQRADQDYWQFIAGGGEDDESTLQATQRESWEEAGIPITCSFTSLQTMTMVPVSNFNTIWPPLPSGQERYVIPEYAFGVNATGCRIRISHEHRAVTWFDYKSALAQLHFDSNRTALWELNQRLRGKGPRD